MSLINLSNKIDIKEKKITKKVYNNIMNSKS